jgi:hypothetical protein
MAKYKAKITLSFIYDLYYGEDTTDTEKPTAERLLTTVLNDIRTGNTTLDEIIELEVEAYRIDDDDDDDVTEWKSNPDVSLTGQIISEENCPGHVAAKNDPNTCVRCGINIEALRPAEEDETYGEKGFDSEGTPR